MAAPMEGPPALDVADIPADVVREIVRRLPCVADRDGAADVCRKWRAALADPMPPPPPPRPLPWLLLPSASAGSTRACCFYCGTDRCRLRHLLSPAHGARCFGSYEGGHGHAIVHFRSREDPKRAFRCLPLPDLLRSCRGDQRAEYMIILAATLSSVPDDNSCVAAGIVMRRHLIAGPRRLAFWRMGDDVPVEGVMASDVLNVRDEVQDVIYYDGAFRFLTGRGFIVACVPAFYPDGGLHGTSESLLRIRQQERLRGQVQARYLVESRGKFLMVVRFTSRPHLLTSHLKVFEIVEQVVNYAGVDKVEHCWIELDSLDGRVLFVGRGCSRSYEVAPYHGLSLKESIYFVDDSFSDEAMMFGNERDRHYPCNDTGKWSDGHVQRCFPEEGASAHSSPYPDTTVQLHVVEELMEMFANYSTEDIPVPLNLSRWKLLVNCAKFPGKQFRGLKIRVRCDSKGLIQHHEVLMLVDSGTQFYV
ncbi:hypothetical protein E2562_002509 [Oryza meyeriana var. granulata]|uniref:KIB1-4 beta-propeller domain-containing protein n=1 Tax=Oryza meyeriana var. granulata TaxID=110450 RepID=A0A6G1F2W1_9ORYZ|nr:hypothetical protein E2562_002509 [Oryza meyeriana var. granulata]